MAEHDLLVKNAAILGEHGHIDRAYDVAFTGNRISLIAPGDTPHSARTEISAGGDLLVPGLIDLHAHVFHGVGGSVEPDDACLGRGTTTVVDAGSAGAATFRAFRRVIDASAIRILAWLNLSTIGLADPRVGELIALPHADVDAAIEAITANRRYIVGIKARLSSYAVGGSVRPVIRLLMEVAAQVELPVMVHIGDTEERLDDILAALRPGDVVTHVLTGRKNGILRGDGTLTPAVWEARERGVLFDAARGANHAAYPVMQAAVEQGFLPDTLATDITAETVSNPGHDMTLLCNELMSYGVPIGDLIPRMTSTPARVIARPDLGVLESGAAADATVLTVEDGEFSLSDVDGRPRRTTRRLVPLGVVRDGRYRQLRGVSPSQPATPAAPC